MIVKFLLLATFAAALVSSLSVTDFGGMKISMLRHGEKYATNRGCYALEDIPPKYHGMTHVRGLNDKSGNIQFRVDVPVRVYLAVDSRYPYIHGKAFQHNGDIITLKGCHAPTPFIIYESSRVYGPGLVTVNFPHRRMTAIFLRDARLVQQAAELKITNTNRKVSMVRHGEKFSTNRACYAIEDVPPKYYGMTHLRGVNDETTFHFDVNVPVTVYAAVDSRYPNALDASFTNTGERITHGGCHTPTPFYIYKREYSGPGTVTVQLAHRRMMTVFVEPKVQNTFKTGTYS